MKPYTLRFKDTHLVRRFPAFTRAHETLDSANDTARRVYEKLEARGLDTQAHAGRVFAAHLPAEGVPV